MSTKNTIVTSILTALITSICTFFVLDYVKSRKKKQKEVIVPQVVDLSRQQAMQILDQHKLRLQIIGKRADPKISRGKICAQHPYAESKVLVHSAVNVVISTGPAPLKVPACEKIKLQAYTLLLSQKELSLGTITYSATKGVPAGHIVSCDPPGSKEVKKGQKINVVIAKAEDPLKEIPKVRGMSCKKAQKKIVEAGFTVGKVRWHEFDAPAYVAMRQSPKEGTKAAPGSAIDLVCSKEE